MSNSRAIAAEIISQLIEEHGSLSSQLELHRDISDFQLLQEYCYGCCRWLHLLRFFVDCLLSKPLKKKDNDILALLLIGIYQLREMRTPDHAAINETVNATAHLKKPWAKGLVNGVLRNYLRKRDELESLAVEQDQAIAYSHPQWLVDSYSRQWPEYFDNLLSSNNQHPPMTLRVNRLQFSRSDYIKQLADADILADEGKLSDTAVYLQNPLSVHELPEFANGGVSVQDEASQLVSSLLALQPGIRVLDACSAPGGKACHMLESECSLSELVSLDKNPARIARVHENLQRLQLQATVLQGDAAKFGEWWDEKPFHRILVDAPCSATGVIRRHPDIKLLRAEKSIESLQQSQLEILRSVWNCLAPNGLLLYTTCSVLNEENSQVIEQFLKQQPDAKYEGIAADWGVECSYGRQLLPLAQQGPDGFFYSLLRRK